MNTFDEGQDNIGLMGSMMDRPLIISTFLQYAESEFGEVEIVSSNGGDKPFRYTYKDLARRSRQLAKALINMGVGKGDRVATLAWNTHQHMELYYAISGIGAICHTINPRYSEEQITYIIKHAEDKAIFFDRDFSARIKSIPHAVENVQNLICLEDTGEASWSSYEALVDAETDDFEWPVFSEKTPSSLCYTSGTTGDPKGVLYSHRSTLLHALVASHRDNLDISSKDIVLPVVPMFHVNAWGIPYVAPITGAKLVLPGRYLDGKSLVTLMNKEAVNIAVGVPTIWLGLLDYMKKSKTLLDTLETIIVGGAAVPKAMVVTFEKEYKIKLIHGWGMTETSPMGSISMIKPSLDKSLTIDEKIDLKAKQGRALYGFEMRIVDDKGNVLPKDGDASGELQVRGPWVVDTYFKKEQSALEPDDWFATGDISTIDSNGYMQITDRSKDVIKSGGEWISSIAVENAASDHEDISMAAVIGVPHEKWLERPLMIAIKKEGAEISEDILKAYLASRMPAWWVPDAIVFKNDLPLGATGKIVKRDLRDEYENFYV